MITMTLAFPPHYSVADDDDMCHEGGVNQHRCADARSLVAPTLSAAAFLVGQAEHAGIHQALRVEL